VLGDDLVVYTSEKHVEAVRDCLQISLTRLMTWFGNLGLSLSTNVSKMIVFFPRNMKIPRFRCGGWFGQAALRNVTEFKYLGIIFDRKLTWRLLADSWVRCSGSFRDQLTSIPTVQISRVW
jgi:hypothetical protein